MNSSFITSGPGGNSVSLCMVLESITVANDLILSYATPIRDGQELATLLALLNL